MRPLRLWQRVGPPTWKRSGTLVFSAVMGVLLIGGTAMAANLGLLAFSASGERGHRLEVPRPPLSVTLPTTETTPPIVDSTSIPEDVEETDDDLDDDGTDESPAVESSTTEDHDDDPGDDTASTSDVDDDDDADDDDADDDDADDDAADDDDADDGAAAHNEPQPDRHDRRGALSRAPGGKAGVFATNGDGSLDDD